METLKDQREGKAEKKPCMSIKGGKSSEGYIGKWRSYHTAQEQT